MTLPGAHHPLRGDLRSKAAIVSGATQGVDEAIATRIAQCGGAGILLTGRNHVRGEAVLRWLEGLGTRAMFVAAACERTFGRIDCLVNAAASTERGGLPDAGPYFIDTMFAANVRAPFLLMQAVARLMRKAGRGCNGQYPVGQCALRHAGAGNVFRHQGRTGDADAQCRQNARRRSHSG